MNRRAGPAGRREAGNPTKHTLAHRYRAGPAGRREALLSMGF